MILIYIYFCDMSVIHFHRKYTLVCLGVKHILHTGLWCPSRYPDYWQWRQNNAVLCFMCLLCQQAMDSLQDQLQNCQQLWLLFCFSTLKQLFGTPTTVPGWSDSVTWISTHMLMSIACRELQQSILALLFLYQYHAKPLSLQLFRQLHKTILLKLDCFMPSNTSCHTVLYS